MRYPTCCIVCSTKAPDCAFAAQNDVAPEQEAAESNGKVGAAQGDSSQQQQQQQRRLPLFDAKVSAEADRHAKLRFEAHF